MEWSFFESSWIKHMKTYEKYLHQLGKKTSIGSS